MSQKRVIEIDVKVGKGTGKLKSDLQETNEEVKKVNNSTSTLTKTLDNMTGGAISKFKNFKSSLGSVATGFKGVGAAITASGIGLLVTVIGSLIAAFKGSEEGQNKFAKLMGVIGAVVGNVIDLFADFGDFIIDLFSGNGAAMSKLKSFGSAIFSVIGLPIKNVIDIVKSLGAALGSLFSGDISGAFEDLKKGVEDVKGNFNEAKEAVLDATDAVKEFAKQNLEEAKAASNVADMRAKADKLERELLVDKAKLENEIAQLRLKSRQEDSVTATQRRQALIDAQELEDQLLKKETEVLNLRADAIAQENTFARSNKENLNAEAEAKAAVIRQEARRTNAARATQRELNRVNRELAAQARAEAKEKQALIDAEIKAEEARLDSIQKLEDKYKKANEDLDAKTEEQKLELEKSRALAEIDALVATEIEKREALLLVNELYDQKENELAEKRKEEELKQAEEAAKKEIEINNKAAEKAQRIADAEAEYKVQTAANVLGALQALAEEGSAGAKAIAVAQAVLSTYQGINKALAETTDFTPTQSLRFLNAALVGVAGFANVAKILSTDSSGATVPTGIGGGGVGSQPQAPSFNVVGQSGVNQLADTLNQEQQPIQAFVVGSQVTTQQELDNNIVNTANIG